MRAVFLQTEFQVLWGLSSTGSNLGWRVWWKSSDNNPSGSLFLGRQGIVIIHHSIFSKQSQPSLFTTHGSVLCYPPRLRLWQVLIFCFSFAGLLQCLGVFLPNNPIPIHLISGSGDPMKVRRSSEHKSWVLEIIESLNILLEDDWGKVLWDIF